MWNRRCFQVSIGEGGSYLYINRLAGLLKVFWNSQQANSLRQVMTKSGPRYQKTKKPALDEDRLFGFRTEGGIEPARKQVQPRRPGCHIFRVYMPGCQQPRFDEALWIWRCVRPSPSRDSTMTGRCTTEFRTLRERIRVVGEAVRFHRSFNRYAECCRRRAAISNCSDCGDRRVKVRNESRQQRMRSINMQEPNDCETIDRID